MVVLQLHLLEAVLARVLPLELACLGKDLLVEDLMREDRQVVLPEVLDQDHKALGKPQQRLALLVPLELLLQGLAV
jgi:hypothetical protein